MGRSATVAPHPRPLSPKGRGEEEFVSIPQGADAVEGGVLHAAEELFQPVSARVGAEGHAEHDAQIALGGGTRSVEDSRSLEHDERIGRGVEGLLVAIGELSLQRALRNATARRLIGQRQQDREVTTAIEIVIVVPVDVVSRLVVAQHGE